MSLNDPLANALSCITNADKTGKSSCIISPGSNIIKEVLKIMKENTYFGDVEKVSEEKGGVLKLNLLGNVNKCGAVKPRFSLTKANYEKFEKRFLPAKGFGILIVTTSQGVMTHTDALKKGTGGKLLAYCY
jgi:small subunit ribosomal protein S8